MRKGNLEGSPQNRRSIPTLTLPVTWPVLVLSILLLFALFAPFMPLDAQDIPTPDVNTVPRPEQVFTPTPTAPPVTVPIVTSTPAGGGNDADNDADNEATDDGSTAETGTGDEDRTESNRSPTEANLSVPLVPTVAPTVNSPAEAVIPIVTNGQPHLVLDLLPNRAFVWQGQTLQLQLRLRNHGDQSAQRVQLRSELPAPLQFVALELSPTGAANQALIVEEPSIGSAGAVSIQWPTLAAAAEVYAILTVRIAPTTPNGSMIDTFAVASAQGTADVVGGITMAMPPRRLPTFR